MSEIPLAYLFFINFTSINFVLESKNFLHLIRLLSWKIKLMLKEKKKTFFSRWWFWIFFLLWTPIEWTTIIVLRASRRWSRYVFMILITKILCLTCIISSKFGLNIYKIVIKFISEIKIQKLYRKSLSFC